MTQIVFDTVRSKYGLPTWKVTPSKYPGSVTLEAIPWRGKLRRWRNGVAKPFSAESDGPPTWEEFSAMKHYRRTGIAGTISVSGIMGDIWVGDIIDESKAVLITDEGELRNMWEKQQRNSDKTEVSLEQRSVAWYLAPGDTQNALIHFSWFWEAEAVTDDDDSVTITFRPGRLAQIRHWFSLKSWTMTVHAQKSA